MFVCVDAGMSLFTIVSTFGRFLKYFLLLETPTDRLPPVQSAFDVLMSSQRQLGWILCMDSVEPLYYAAELQDTKRVLSSMWRLPRKEQAEKRLNVVQYILSVLFDTVVLLWTSCLWSVINDVISVPPAHRHRKLTVSFTHIVFIPLPSLSKPRKSL